MRRVIYVLGFILLLGMVTACAPQATPTEPPPEPLPTLVPTREPPPPEEPEPEPEPAAEPAEMPAEAADADIVDIIWNWQGFSDQSEENDIVVPDPDNYRLQLRPDGQYVFKADCNVGSGTYTLDGGSLTLEPGPITLAECGPDSLSNQYLQQLGLVRTYVREGDTLHLNLMADAGNMNFNKLHAVTGRVLAEEGATFPAGSVLEIRVDDVSLADAPATQVGGQVIADARRFPINFEATYNPEAIDPRFTYGLDVKIRDAEGNLLFTNTRAYNVITGGFPTYDVDVMVEQVGGMTPEGVGTVLDGVGIDPATVSIDTQGLPYSWQANLVPATPYDNSQPPGPKGLPEHIQINFGVVDPKDKQPGDPVLYIIPARAYRQQWLAAGDPSVIRATADLLTLLYEQPDPIPTSGMPVLPFEEIGGPNDLAVQGQYDNFGISNGVAFVGRHSQGPNPVINEGLRYMYQGLSVDADHLIAFFYPVTTSALPTSADQVPAEEMQKVDTDPEGYLQEKAAQLNGLSSSEWEPDLATLDALVSSLTYQRATAKPIPTVVIPTPAPQRPMGRVTASGNLNIRSGPGTNYPIVGVAPSGAEGEIIGRSADGQWWVAAVPEAPNGQGWLSAAFVGATNAENVPVIPAPPPPAPTPPPPPPPAPTPTLTPTAQAGVQIDFRADRTRINPGECTRLHWKVENIQRVWVYPQGARGRDYGVAGEGSTKVCPLITTTYQMRVQKRDNSIEKRQITIRVRGMDRVPDVNPLANTNWQLPASGTTLTVSFSADGTIRGNGGCNSFSGTYTLLGTALAIGSLAVTGSTCGDAIDQQERAYLAALQSAASIDIGGNQLIIRNASGREVLRLNRSS